MAELMLAMNTLALMLLAAKLASSWLPETPKMLPNKMLVAAVAKPW